MENEVPERKEEEQTQETQAPVTDAAPAPPPPPASEPPPAEGLSSEEKSWAMGCHLIALITSFVGPLILWLIKREGNPFVDEQGKEALNFQLTVLLAVFVSKVLCFLLIAFVLLPVIGVLHIVFVIIATTRVNNGEHYRYPVCLRLIK